jgi:hypothetical protein
MGVKDWDQPVIRLLKGCRGFGVFHDSKDLLAEFVDHIVVLVITFM